VVKFLCRCLTLIKFEGNLKGVSVFCVDLTRNDPYMRQAVSIILGYSYHAYKLCMCASFQAGVGLKRGMGNDEISLGEKYG
jgi:hypothetical protein